MDMEKLRGQGATEYLMVFAGVLFISIVAVVVLGFFPSFAGDAAITTSNTYWRNEARPFAIMEHSAFAANGTFFLRVENAGVERMSVTGISGCSASSSEIDGANPIEIVPGESRIIPLLSSVTATAGDIYECSNITINYTTKSQIPKVQYGEQKFVGRYV